MDLFSAAEGSRKIPCSIHSSCISLEFITGNILHFQHLTENGISHSVVALPADLISIRIDHRYDTKPGLIQELFYLIKLVHGPVAFIYSAKLQCHPGKPVRHLSIRSGKTGHTENTGISLSDLQHRDHPVIVAFSDHPKLCKAAVTPGCLPQ